MRRHASELLLAVEHDLLARLHSWLRCARGVEVGRGIAKAVVVRVHGWRWIAPVVSCPEGDGDGEGGMAK